MAEYSDSGKLTNFFKSIPAHFEPLPAMEQALYCDAYATDLQEKIDFDFNYFTHMPHGLPGKASGLSVELHDSGGRDIRTLIQPALLHRCRLVVAKRVAVFGRLLELEVHVPLAGVVLRVMPRAGEGHDAIMYACAADDIGLALVRSIGVHVHSLDALLALVAPPDCQSPLRPELGVGKLDVVDALRADTAGDVCVFCFVALATLPFDSTVHVALLW